MHFITVLLRKMALRGLNKERTSLPVPCTNPHSECPSASSMFGEPQACDQSNNADDSRLENEHEAQLEHDSTQVDKVDDEEEEEEPDATSLWNASCNLHQASSKRGMTLLDAGIARFMATATSWH